MDTLAAAAGEVAGSVPEGLTQGDITAGLYGLGFLGRWALPRLIQSGVKLVSCYDANQALVGRCAGELPVLAPSELKRGAPEFVFVTARHAIAPVSAMLAELGVAHVSYDAWHVASNFAAFRRIHDDILGDDRSREVLRGVLLAMLTGNSRFCRAIFEKDQYFCLPQFCGAGREIYVDAGAFVGDSVERFIWSQNGVFSKIFAFEPGPRQFSALRSRTRRLVDEWALDDGSIELINAGLGETECSVPAGSSNEQLTNLSIHSSFATTGTTADVVSLDGFIGGGPVTFLKADVEGMEMALLKGGQSAIRQHKPKIAICVYHYPTDIPEIANYLAELVPQYRFALRHHSPQLLETVLYCWID